MADMMEYKCPSCGGAMEFDSTTQKMKCPYCDTEMEVAQYQEVTDVKVTKIWNDAGNQDGKRATEIKVKLFADGSEVAGSEVTLKADNNWTYTWKDLAVYKNGTAIAYTVDETTTKSWESILWTEKAIFIPEAARHRV